eukprot:CAMPEP_0119524440 /NCGR_PEP_ID=MMETSP1344-20130328/39371_1 /TAXON_ID=236787 /ORGANISM="Florenciella parvula, Strain CCMP2471" /LENGTH=34 /DNA_ID= /DNA_START= /DNA_END= /DNA_ORIENTATION=
MSAIDDAEGETPRDGPLHPRPLDALAPSPHSGRR